MDVSSDCPFVKIRLFTGGGREGFSPVATGDQRYAALDPRHLLEKVDENFSQKSFLIG